MELHLYGPILKQNKWKFMEQFGINCLLKAITKDTMSVSANLIWSPKYLEAHPTLYTCVKAACGASHQSKLILCLHVKDTSN